ncbi:MAG: hypothetical protein ABI867_31995 [Kofleriaceae bacterium]
MENTQCWDRLTACLTVVELRDLAAVWGFLAHTGVIEHERRGAFDQVVTAVMTELARGDITGGSVSARVAVALRDLQTPRGAQADPGAIDARRHYQLWQSTRASRPRIA